MLTIGDHDLPPYDSNGVDAKYCILCLENGEKVPTCDLETVRRVAEGKMSVNLQIKLWAADVGILLMPNELKEYCRGMPEWVYTATLEQAKKRILKEVGFIPTFLRIGLGDLP
jgi:hypothetical protein